MGGSRVESADERERRQEIACRNSPHQGKLRWVRERIQAGWVSWAWLLVRRGPASRVRGAQRPRPRGVRRPESLILWGEPPGWDGRRPRRGEGGNRVGKVPTPLALADWPRLPVTQPVLPPSPGRRGRRRRERQSPHGRPPDGDVASGGLVTPKPRMRGGGHAAKGAGTSSPPLPCAVSGGGLGQQASRRSCRTVKGWAGERETPTSRRR